MPSPLILLHSRDDLDHTITLSINGQRWEYHLTPQQCDTTEYLCRNISALKALAYAKSRANRAVRISAICM